MSGPANEKETTETPSLEDILNPFEILVNSNGIDEDIEEEIERIKNPNPDIPTPCGTIKIDATDCDPLEVEIETGTEIFSPVVGKYRYING